MTLRLHRSGRFRTWLGTRLGGDLELGDRVWRRVLHGLCAAVLVYYLLPDAFFIIAPKEVVLVAALLAVLVLELMRHFAGLELPTIRPYEQKRIASFAFFAIAIVLAVLLFPEPIAAAVVLGTALVDPLAGELRVAGVRRATLWAAPMVAYAGLAFVGLALVGRWPIPDALGLAVLAAPIAVAVERPKSAWVDDDLAMTFVPAIVLYVLGVLVLRLPV
jgi:dolichol kinase